ncbi:MAG: hypothetical protein SPK79_06890 [Erysipelotrichaceae bacterium]|nr:hypothetical protein [Erysipelotrichaceae bacterium]
MKRPELEYAENCTLIHTYARKLEEYCDELEECNNILCSDMENLRESLDYELQVKIEKIERLEKALDKACERLESFDRMSYCPPEKHWSKEKWKEWCMK